MDNTTNTDDIISNIDRLTNYNNKLRKNIRIAVIIMVIFACLVVPVLIYFFRDKGFAISYCVILSIVIYIILNKMTIEENRRCGGK